MLNQIRTPRLHDRLNYISLRFPNERIFDGEGLTGHQRDEILKTTHHLWVRRPGGATSSNLSTHWQIETDDAVFIEAHAFETKHPRNRRANGNEQE